MNKFIILLTWMVSLTAAGVLDHGRVGIRDRDNIGINRVDTDRILRMSRVELLRQKFLLDVLQHVHQPLVNDELLRLGDRLIVDQNVCTVPIDNEMQHVIDLARNGRLLSRDERFSVTNEDHVRQMVGIYRILMCIRDWDTFQRNVIHLRKNINGVLLVNSLLLVVRDRQDTQMLIVPGIQDILPEVYNDVDIVRRVSDMDLSHLVTNTETRRPGLMELVGMGRRQRLMNRLNNGLLGGTGRMSMMDRTQMWMPWRDMHMQMAAQRVGDIRGQQLVNTRTDGRVQTVIGLNDGRVDIGNDNNNLRTLLIDDMGMKSFVHGLVNDLILRSVDDGQRNDGQGIDMDVRMGDRVTGNMDRVNRVGDRMDIMDRNRDDRVDRMDIMDRNRDDRVDRMDIMDRNRDDRVDRMDVMDRNRDDRVDRVDRMDIMDRNRIDRTDRMDIMDRNRVDRTDRMDIMDRKRVDRTDRLDTVDRMERVNRLDNLDRLNRVDRMDRMDNADRLPVSDVNNGRLLHVNRRRMQTDMDMNMGVGDQSQVDTDSHRFLNVVRGGEVHDGRRVVDNVRNRNMDDSRERDMDASYDSMEDRRRVMTDRDLDRDDVLIHNRRGNMRGLGGDMDLPTTDVNNDRLVHMNRRRLVNLHDDIHRNMVNRRGGQIHDGRRVVDDDNDDDVDRNDVDLRRRVRLGMRNRNTVDRNIDVDLDDDTDDVMMDRRRMMMGNRHDMNDMNLRTTDINNGRLLHVNRRRLQNVDDRNTVLGNDRSRFMNVVRGGHQIHDGRRVMNDDDSMERVQMGSNRNMRRLNDNLPTTTIDDERLLHVNRQRVHKMMLAKNDDGLRGRDDDRMILDDMHRTGRMGVMRGNRVVNGRRVVDNDNVRRGNFRRDNDDDNWNGDVDMDLNDIDIDDFERMHGGRRNGRVGGGRGDVRSDSWRQRDGMRGVNVNEDDDVNNDVRCRKGGRLCHSRRSRSLDNTDMGISGGRNMMDRMRGGEVLLHNLHQLMARINLETMALGIDDGLNVDDVNVNDDRMSVRMNNRRLVDNVDERYALRMNDMRQDNRRDRLVLDKINDVTTRLNDVLRRELNRVGGNVNNVRVTSTVNNIIGNVLMGRVDRRVGLLNILLDVLLMDDTNRDVSGMTDVGVAMDNGCARRMMRRVLRIIDNVRQEVLGSYKRDDLMLDGVTINNVIVDNLRTHIDLVDSDLINLLDGRMTGNNENIQTSILGRQRRINHKNFNIRIDVNSNRDQRVVVRTLLIPVVDGNGNQLTLEQQRINGIVLDGHIVDLRTGHNTINRKSIDIDWTARDTTTYTEIYQRVMTIINGKTDLTDVVGGDVLNQGVVVGQTCRFPHRLLLPRGRVDGMRMQMLVMINRIEDIDTSLHNIRDRRDLLCGIGVGSQNLDRRSITFPLDRQIDDRQVLHNLSNVRLLDVTITHDDRLNH